MITEAMFTAARETAENGLAEAVVQGWGREAGNVLAPVNTALHAGHADEARAVITDQLATVAADPCSARGLFLERILQDIDAALTTAAERDDQAAFEAAILADMRAFLSGAPVPAVFEAPAPAALATLF